MDRQIDFETDLVALQPRIAEIREFARSRRKLSPRASSALDQGATPAVAPDESRNKRSQTPVLGTCGERHGSSCSVVERRLERFLQLTTSIRPGSCGSIISAADNCFAGSVTLRDVLADALLRADRANHDTHGLVTRCQHDEVHAAEGALTLGCSTTAIYLKALRMAHDQQNAKPPGPKVRKEFLSPL